jgi:ubiquinone/menaquinone biosynthesis C-methylase UbiE
MHFFKMEGPWNGWMAWLYDAIVAEGIGDLYDAVAEGLLSDLPAGSRVLDLGCGSGQIATRAARRNPRAFVFGLDLSQGQVARAHTRGLGVPNVRFGVGDALCLPLADGGFDLVISAAMIKHLPDRRQGLTQMRRVCREGGTVCVIEVDRESSREAAAHFVNRWRWVLPGTRRLCSEYFVRFVAGQGLTEKELVTLFGDAGLSSVNVQRVPDQPFVVGFGHR